MQVETVLSLNEFIERMNHELACGNAPEATRLAKLMADSYPSSAQGLFCAGSIVFQVQQYQSAIAFLTQSLMIKPYYPQAMEYLLYALFMEKEGQGFSSDAYAAVTQILQKPENLNSDLIVRVWAKLVLTHPFYGRVVRDAALQDYDAFKLWFTGLAADKLALLSDDFITLGISLYILPDVQIEHLLLYIRRFFLDVAQDSVAQDILPHYEKIALALAAYCFNSDYLLDMKAEERKKLDAILASIASGSKVEAFMICVVASYDPLYKFDDITKALGKLFSPVVGQKKLKALIRQQIQEPKMQEELIADMPSLLQIKDDVSEKVRQQYEENPYPKWVLPKAVVLDNMADKITGYTKSGAKVLIAGCATGAYPINVARALPKAQISGIDLSLASLCYGRRKAIELKVKNLEFIHGDILNIGEYGRRFDVIETIGVLHHMKEPQKGLDALLGVLNDDGFIKIGLYSAHARRNIIACQKEFVEQGFAPTTKGIRDSRQYILALSEDHPFKTFMKYNDFYNLSMMRDMLFHVQEHCYTIPKIITMLAQADLEFMGFSDIGLDDAKLAYQTQFPEDEAMSNLENWHVFELKNPDTFIGMYKFWCRKIKAKR